MDEPTVRAISPDVAQEGAGRPRARPFEVTVNGAKSGTWVLVEYNAELYASLEALIQWRLTPSATRSPLRFKGIEYHSLAGISGYNSKADFTNQSVEINFAPDAFSETLHGVDAHRRAETGAVEPSLFLNYEFNLQRISSPGTPTQQSSGQLGEAGFSSPLGLLTTSFMGQHSIGEVESGRPRFLRLETTITADIPDSNRSLYLGDTSTRLGMLGNSLYFAGVRLGTDFSLSPGFISQPLPIAKGVSSAPSTVDLYINNVLRQTTQVPSGPFSIENFPPMNGAGDIRMVVRDVFGRESVITRSFFSSNRLLAPGLSDWSIEAGRIRHDMGSPTSYYGEPFVRGLIRYGLNEQLTLEGVGEGTGKQKNLQMGLSMPIAGWLGSGALAASQTTEKGAGYRWLASLEDAGLRYGISLQAIGASESYRTLASELPVARQQLSSNLSYAAGDMGSFGLGFTSIRTFDNKQIDTQSANYSFRVGSRGMLSLALSQSEGANYRGMALGATLVLPLDKGPTAIVSVNRKHDGTDVYASATDNPRRDSPLGWRTLVGQRQGWQREEAGLDYWNRRYRLTADVSHDESGMSAQRASVGGALVFVGGSVFALRESSDSHALVEVPGYANVRVGLNNMAETRTDANGIALVGNLQSYQENSITLNAQDLPISAELDSIEQVAVPGRNSVVRVRFPVRAGQGALIRVVFEDGRLPPPGAIVRIKGDAREFFVARRGEVFVTGLLAKNSLELKHPGGECRFRVEMPPALQHKITRLGPLECTGSVLK